MKTKIFPLHPLNVTGYFDGEGCFNVSVYLNPKMKTGYSVTFSAEFKQHSNSENLLYSLKNFFDNKGSISYSNKTKTVLRYKISNINDIVNLVIPLPFGGYALDKYSLITSKQLNYLDFKKAILLINSKKHLTEEGINEIIKITKNMNTYRPFEEKWKFCYNQSLNKNIIIAPEWLSSFADSEGFFNFRISSLGNSTACTFSISQNVHDYHVMALIIKYFKCGSLNPLIVNETFESANNYYKERKNNNLNSIISFTITSRELSKTFIIPFFEKYSLYSTKALDFEDWKTLIKLADDKAYLTEDGKIKMLKLSKGMNNNRKLDLFLNSVSSMQAGHVGEALPIKENPT